MDIPVDKLCDWGCGQPATHYFPYSKKFCCGYNVSKCPSKNKKMVETRQQNGSYVSGYHKGRETMASTLTDDGITVLERSYARQSKTKTIIGDDGKSIAQKSAEKMVETRRATIDQDTGKDLCQIVGQKSAETKYHTFDENGHNMHKISGQRSLKTKLIFDENGNTWFDRVRDGIIKKNKEHGRRLHEERLADVDENGLDHYARRTEKMLNDIIDGKNAIERAQIKAKQGCKRKYYKDTNIHYQGSLEEHFLNELERIYGLPWMSEHVMNGSYIKYWNPSVLAFRYYIPDFIIQKRLYEVKSNYTWNNHGENIELEKINKAKLVAAQQAGYDVFLVLEGETIQLEDVL